MKEIVVCLFYLIQFYFSFLSFHLSALFFVGQFCSIFLSPQSSLRSTFVFFLSTQDPAFSTFIFFLSTQHSRLSTFILYRILTYISSNSFSFLKCRWADVEAITCFYRFSSPSHVIKYPRTLDRYIWIMHFKTYR